MDNTVFCHRQLTLSTDVSHVASEVTLSPSTYPSISPSPPLPPLLPDQLSPTFAKVLAQSTRRENQRLRCMDDDDITQELFLSGEEELGDSPHPQLSSLSPIIQRDGVRSSPRDTLSTRALAQQKRRENEHAAHLYDHEVRGEPILTDEQRRSLIPPFSSHNILNQQYYDHNHDKVLL